MRKKKNGKEGKVFGVASGVSATGSIISAHNVCHAVCLAVVAILSVFGIIVSSDVLMWLQDYNLFFWTMGISFLVISLVLYYKKPCCISSKLILFNTGLIIIGFPFLAAINLIFWVFGGGVTLFSIGWYFRDRIAGRNRHSRFPLNFWR